MVTTPVPPIPVINMLHGVETAGITGAGRFWVGSAACFARTARRKPPPRTVTKLGQKPFTQLKSLLQSDWSIRRLRPSAVSSGLTAIQLD
jgi:hypothetical protein